MNETIRNIENKKLMGLYSEIKELALETETDAFKLNLVNSESRIGDIMNDLVAYKSKLKKVQNLCSGLLKTPCENEKKREVLRIQEESNRALRKISAPNN